MVAIKICGMKDPANIAEIALLRPEYMGFICWEGSQRYIGDTLCADTLLHAELSAARVGVFVNQDMKRIGEFVERLGLTVVQLHGDESPEFCDRLKQQLSSIEIWKAIAVSDHYPHEPVEEYQGRVDRILFDTRSPGRGGSGLAFDWSILSDWNSGSSLVLSGGLGIENIEEALQVSKGIVSVVDLNSKLESAPGIKDPKLVEKVVALIRATCVV